MVSISFVVAMVLLPLFLAVCGLALWAGYRLRTDWADDEPGIGWAVQVVASLCLLGVVIGFGYGLYPYRWEYHSYKPVAGVAQKDVESRLLGGDGGPTEYFLVSLPGERYRCEDTRCATIKKGDRVALSCIKEWVYSGTDGWECRFVSVTTP